MPATTVFFDLGDTLVFNNAAAVSTRFDDALDTLQMLHERGYRIGLLSNQAAGTTLAQVQARLAGLGLARWIDAGLVTISSEVAGNLGKPAQPIFNLALAKAGHAVASAQSIFITEDAAHVHAARGFGWRAIVIRRAGTCGAGDGECVNSLAGLLVNLPSLAGWGGTLLQLAPPPRVVNGLWAVSVDISRINARLSFDATTQTAQGDAKLEFTLGRHAGCPVFDLRQTPTGAWLDGAVLPLAEVAAHDFGGGALAEMRVLARVIDAGSSHTLRLRYAIGAPQASTAGSYLPQISWSAGPRLVYNFGFTDLGPGRYLEAFVPANLVFDQFELLLELQLSGSANAALTLNFANPAVELSSRNPWVRVTPSASYSAGERLFKGLAAVLVDRMNDFYRTRASRPASTEELESHLLASTGRPELVDAFHRFVYGLPDPTPVPDLWLRDDPGDAGAQHWPGRFWDSPDLWVRNLDDGGLSHQNPEFGQDNWLYARVRNRSNSATARHLMVSFNTKSFAGSQSTYPADWLPAVTAAAAFDLGPGQTRIVKARWPRAAVPPAGSHPCLLEAVFTRFDAPVAGHAVWEQNNLAQKNLTVVNLQPNRWFVLPFVATQLRPRMVRLVSIELVRPPQWAELEATLLLPASALIPATRSLARPLPAAPDQADAANLANASTDALDCGCAVHATALAPRDAEAIAEQALGQRFPGALELSFKRGERAGLRVTLRPLESTRLGLRFKLPANAAVGARFTLDVVQREGKRVVGGVAVTVNVVA